MNLAPHLPALQVVVPLMAAPLTVLLRRRSLAFAVAVAATWLAFGTHAKTSMAVLVGLRIRMFCPRLRR